MSLKPKMILTEEIVSQAPQLLARKNELTLAHQEVSARLASIEQVMKENSILEAKTKEQVAESLSLLLEEAEKVKECYPEIRFNILQKALEFATPADAKKK
jgi:NADH:ubiquinone oxidoreductase subunit E